MSLPSVGRPAYALLQDDKDCAMDAAATTAECRICQGADSVEGNPLMRPCACTGSLTYVHAQCLREWIVTRRDSRMHCEVCHQPYRIQLESAVQCSPKLLDFNSLSHVLEAGLLLGCAILTLYVLVAARDSIPDSPTGALVWALLAVCCITTLLAFKKIYSRWVVASSELVLQPDESGVVTASATATAEQPPALAVAQPSSMTTTTTDSTPTSAAVRTAELADMADQPLDV